MVWTADNKKMYIVDTGSCTLLEWDYDPDKGPVGKSRTVLDFKETFGTPDGLSIDEEGSLYIAHWTGKISVWDKNLQLMEEVKFPVEQVCCGGFGGSDMKDFYVTSARFHYTAEQLGDRRGAGGIFKARLSVAGLPDHYY
jgi:sugar lactone lactonase YvrE